MWWPVYPTPGDWLYGSFKTSEIGGWNMGFNNDPDVDALIEKGMSLEGTDRAGAIKAYQEAQKILADEASDIFIADLHEIVVKRKDVKGFVINPAYSSNTFIFFYQLHRE